MRAIIMAGGADEKWTREGGKGRRHFQMILGERVLDRLIRQLRERGVSDIYIVCPMMEGYFIEGTDVLHPTYSEWGHEGLNARDHWSDTDRTLMIYGDTIFADKAMDRIVGFSDRKFQMFGRFGNGVIKGGGGELFAFSFWPEQRDAWEHAVRESFRLKDSGVIERAGSWEGYRYMAGARGRMVGRRGHRLYPDFFTNIDDRLTDDFDTPRQYRKLVLLFQSKVRRRAA